MQVNVTNLTSGDIGAKRDRVSDHFYKEMTVLQPDTQAGRDGFYYSQTPCRFRFYSSGSTVHCIAWISGSEVYGSGYGKAGGYGYCKESAAMQDALANAGINMSEHWGGMGDSKMREAALAVAKAVTGKRKFILNYSHG